jgi:hypothetical protein
MPLSAVETCQRPQDLTAFKKEEKGEIFNRHTFNVNSFLV